MAKTTKKIAVVSESESGETKAVVIASEKRTRKVSTGRALFAKMAGLDGRKPSAWLDEIAVPVAALTERGRTLGMSGAVFLAFLAKPENLDQISRAIISQQAANKRREADELEARLNNPVTCVPCALKPDTEAEAENS